MVKNEKGVGHLALFLVVIVLAAIGFVGWRVSQSSTSKNQAKSNDKSQTAKVPAKTVDKTGAFKLQAVSAGGCQALLPAGWQQPKTNDTSTTFDAFSSDNSMYAGYGHQAINTSLAAYASAYSPPLNDAGLYSSDPATVALAYSKIIAANLGSSGSLNYTTTTNQQVGDYQLRSIASATYEGAVFYHLKGLPGDGTNYTYSLPMYFAMASKSQWQANGPSISRVSASINCTAQLVARSSGPDIGGSSSSDKDKQDSNGDKSGYNPQLGTEYVHDPSTGENFLVDPSRDWSSSGPNGGGYYKVNGNDYTQLQPGRSD